MEFCDMGSKDDSPPRFPDMPSNLSKAHRQTRETWFNKTIQKFVETFVFRFTGDSKPTENKDSQREVTVSGKDCKEPPKQIRVFVQRGTKIYQVSFPKSMAGQTGLVRLPDVQGLVTVNIPGMIDSDTKGQDSPPEDDVVNYSKQLCQYILLLISFKDAIQMGDVVRINIHLKQLIPLFYSHSKLSKYYEDCTDYILKTEVLLTPRLAMRVRCGSLVNKFGGKGNNKEHDKETERQVQSIKTVIRSLVSHKEKEIIVAAAKAAPVIVTISEQFSEEIGLSSSHRPRKHKSAQEDEEILGKEIRNIRPFQNRGRQMTQFRRISSDPFERIDTEQFESYTLRVVKRLQRGNVRFPPPP